MSAQQKPAYRFRYQFPRMPHEATRYLSDYPTAERMRHELQRMGAQVSDITPVRVSASRTLDDWRFGRTPSAAPVLSGCDPTTANR